MTTTRFWRKKKYPTQKEKFFRFLFENVTTCTMASDNIKIPQKNLCRYKRQLEGQGKLWQVSHSKCPVTGQMAWFLTTNPNWEDCL